MAATKVPLNLFKRITIPLKRDVDEQVYTVPLDRATIFINTLVSNNSDKKRLVTLSVTNSATSSNFVIAKDVLLDKTDIKNIISSKIVLTEEDNVLVKADIEDIRTIDDPSALWEFNLPPNLSELENFTIGFTNSTQVTADFGVDSVLGDPQKAFNADFDDWAGWTPQTFPVSGGVLGTGPTNWRQGLDIVSTPAAQGTYQLLQGVSGPEESVNFDNQFYSRVQLNNVSFSGDFINDPKLPARGILAATGGEFGPVIPEGVPAIATSSEEFLFGKTLLIKMWLRASSDTKVVVDAPAWFDYMSVGSPGFTPVSLNNQFTIFNVTTAWTQHETQFVVPTLSAWRQETFNRNLIDINDPDWGTPSYVYPFIDPSIVFPLSAYRIPLRVNIFRGPYNLLVDGYNPNTWTIAASANSALITNGYYDIGGLEIIISTGTSFAPLTSFVPVDYIYDLSNETDANITLSILETSNLLT